MTKNPDRQIITTLHANCNAARCMNINTRYFPKNKWSSDVSE